MHRVRLLVAYEAPGGALRTTQLALEFHVVAALSAGALMLAPVPRQLAAWRLDVSLRQHREVQAHAQLAGGRFDVAAVGARCGYWRLTGAGEAGGAGAAQVCALTTSVSVEGASSGTVRVELAPRLQDGNGTLGGEAPEALQRRMSACSLLLPWRHESGGKRASCGVLVLPSVQLAALIQGSALRMTAHVPAAVPGPLHACTVRARGAVTIVDVTLRLRNCGALPVSLCVECGHFASEGATAPLVDTVPAAAGGDSPAEQYTVATGLRHTWLGAVRRHVRCLAAQAEQEWLVQLALTGAGAFAVSDCVCVWNAPECGVLGRTLQCERLEVFVSADASAG